MRNFTFSPPGCGVCVFVCHRRQKSPMVMDVKPYRLVGLMNSFIQHFTFSPPGCSVSVFAYHRRLLSPMVMDVKSSGLFGRFLNLMRSFMRNFTFSPPAVGVCICVPSRQKSPMVMVLSPPDSLVYS
jgi:hypothetical protein